MTSLKVAVRVRPLSERESCFGSNVVVDVIGQDIIVQDTKVPEHRTYDHRIRIHRFTFDYGFWSVDSTSQKCASQKTVYEDFGLVVLNTLLQGYNSCVIAYGPSGSGKTYTMMGTKEETGLTPRICEGLFTKLTDQSDNQLPFQIDISFMEIYNEQVFDLLCKNDAGSPRKPKLRVREHPINGPFVEGLSMHIVKNIDEVFDLLTEGNENRKKADTHVHDRSSRSHAIFTIRCLQGSLNETEQREVVSKLHLVDLAGSEKASPEFCHSRLTEGGNINKSLVTLGNVISVLVEMPLRNSNVESSNKQTYVPYRDSHLTWLLKDSLGGNSHTFMLAAISPSKECYIETVSTLRYAQRAKLVMNRPVLNEDPSTEMLRTLKTEVTNLKNTIITSTQGLKKPFVMKPLPDIIHLRSVMEESAKKVDMLTRHWFDKWLKTYDVVLNKVLNSTANSSEKPLRNPVEQKESILLDLEKANQRVTALLEGVLNQTENTRVSNAQTSQSSECIILMNDSVAFSGKKHNPDRQFKMKKSLSLCANLDKQTNDANQNTVYPKRVKEKKFLSNSDNLYKLQLPCLSPFYKFSSVPERNLSFPNYFGSTKNSESLANSSSGIKSNTIDSLTSKTDSHETVKSNQHSTEISDNEIHINDNSFILEAVEDETTETDSKCSHAKLDENVSLLSFVHKHKSEYAIIDKPSDHSFALHNQKPDENVTEEPKLTNEVTNLHPVVETQSSIIPPMYLNDSNLIWENQQKFQVTSPSEVASVHKFEQSSKNVDHKNDMFLYPFMPCTEIAFTDQVQEESINIVKYLQINAPESIESYSRCCSPKRKDSEIMSLLSFSSFDCPFIRSLDDLSSNEDSSSRQEIQDNEISTVHSSHGPHRSSTDPMIGSKFSTRKSGISDVMCTRSGSYESKHRCSEDFKAYKRNRSLSLKQLEPDIARTKFPIIKNNYHRYDPSQNQYNAIHNSLFESDKAVGSSINQNEEKLNIHITENSFENSTLPGNISDRISYSSEHMKPYNTKHLNCTEFQHAPVEPNTNAISTPVQNNAFLQLTKANLDLLEGSQERNKEETASFDYLSSCIPYIQNLNQAKQHEFWPVCDYIENKSQQLRPNLIPCKTSKILENIYIDTNQNCLNFCAGDKVWCSETGNNEISLNDNNIYERHIAHDFLLPIQEEVSSDMNENKLEFQDDITVDSLDNLEFEMEMWAKKYLTNKYSQSGEGNESMQEQVESNSDQLHLSEYEISMRTKDYKCEDQTEEVLDHLEALLQPIRSNSLCSSLSSSSDSITYVFVNKEEHEKLQQITKSEYSSVLGSVSLDSLEKSSALQKIACLSPRTLSIDSLLAEELLAQLKSSALNESKSNMIQRRTFVDLNFRNCAADENYNSCSVDDYSENSIKENASFNFKDGISSIEQNQNIFAFEANKAQLIEIFSTSETSQNSSKRRALTVGQEEDKYRASFDVDSLAEADTDQQEQTKHLEWCTERPQISLMVPESNHYINNVFKNEIPHFGNQDSMSNENDFLYPGEESILFPLCSFEHPALVSSVCKVSEQDFDDINRNVPNCMCKSTQTDEYNENPSNSEPKYDSLPAVYLDLTMRMMEFMTETLKILKEERSKPCCNHNTEKSYRRYHRKGAYVKKSSEVEIPQRKISRVQRKKKISCNRNMTPFFDRSDEYVKEMSEISSEDENNHSVVHHSRTSSNSSTKRHVALSNKRGIFEKNGRDNHQPEFNSFHQNPHSELLSKNYPKHSSLVSNASNQEQTKVLQHLQNLLSIRRKVIQETRSPPTTFQQQKEEYLRPSRIRMPQSSSSEGYLSSISSQGLCKQFSECYSGSYTFDGKNTLTDSIYGQPCSRSSQFQGNMDHDMTPPKTSWQNTSADSGAFVMDSPLTEKSDIFLDFHKADESPPGDTSFDYNLQSGKYFKVQNHTTGISPTSHHQPHQLPLVAEHNDPNKYKTFYDNLQSKRKIRSFQDVQQDSEDEYLELENKSSSFLQKISDINYILKREDIERILASIKKDEKFLQRPRNCILNPSFYSTNSCVDPLVNSDIELFSCDSYKCLPNPYCI